MEKKKRLFAWAVVFLAFIFNACIVQAQDKVELKDGSTISCNIKEITEQNLIFQQEGVQDNETLPISEILSITYANGEKDVFGFQKDDDSQETLPAIQEDKTKYSSLGDGQQLQTQNKNSYDTWDFWEFNYNADFEAADKGYYSPLGWHLINGFCNGVGLSFRIGTNLGLVDSDFSSVIAMLGPNFAIDLTKEQRFYLFAPLYLNLVASFQNYEDSNGKKKEKTKYTFGAQLEPSILIRIKKATLRFGCSLNWADGSKKIGTGFIAGIGFQLKN